MYIFFKIFWYIIKYVYICIALWNIFRCFTVENINKIKTFWDFTHNKPFVICCNYRLHQTFKGFFYGFKSIIFPKVFTILKKIEWFRLHIWINCETGNVWRLSRPELHNTLIAINSKLTQEQGCIVSRVNFSDVIKINNLYIK